MAVLLYEDSNPGSPGPSPDSWVGLRMDPTAQEAQQTPALLSLWRPEGHHFTKSLSSHALLGL